MTDLFSDLRAAVEAFNQWPDSRSRAQVIGAARLFVEAVDHRAAMIEHMRQRVTPSDQALNEILERDEP